MYFVISSNINTEKEMKDEYVQEIFFVVILSPCNSTEKTLTFDGMCIHTENLTITKQSLKVSGKFL